MNGFVCKLLPFSAAFAVTLSLHAAAPTDFAKTITGTAPAGLLLSGGTLPAADGGLLLVAPAEGAVVPLLNETQKAFLALPRAERVAAFADEAFRRELKERGGARPAPPEPVAALLDTLVSNMERRLKTFSRPRKGRRPGASRITGENRSLWLDTLGVRTDLDLRRCISGQDRTGAVAFILNALLGVDEEELYRDWEATGFHNANTSFNHERKFNLLVRGFDRWPGDSINERVEAYVLSLGFTPVDLAAFRNLLLEPVPCDALP